MCFRAMKNCFLNSVAYLVLSSYIDCHVKITISAAMQEIWWPLSGGYRESVAPMLPVPHSFYLTKGALMKHNDLLSAAKEKEEQIKQKEQKLLRLQQDEKLKLLLQNRWPVPRCERPPPMMIDDSEKMHQETKQNEQQENNKKVKQQSQASHNIFQTKIAQPFCERPDVTGVFITKDIAAQEEPHRLERFLPISEVVKKLEKAEYAMKEYEWRWTRVVDKSIRAICKWTRLMLTIATVEFFPELNPRLRVENMQCVDSQTCTAK